MIWLTHIHAYTLQSRREGQSKKHIKIWLNAALTLYQSLGVYYIYGPLAVILAQKYKRMTLYLLKADFLKALFSHNKLGMEGEGIVPNIQPKINITF